MSGNQIISVYKDASVLQPLIPGISEVLSHIIVDLALPAGVVDKDMPTVPENHIYVYTNIALRYTGTPPTAVYVRIMVSSQELNLYALVPPTNNLTYDKQGFWAISAGNNLRCSLLNATLNNDFYFYACGYDMKIGTG